MSAQDVLVIGGGVMGCGIALRLAQAGARVTVLERAIPGAEASSAAAGILAPQTESDRPGPLLDLGLRSRALYPDFARELKELSGIDIHHLPSGVLRVAFTEATLEAHRATAAWQTGLGLRAEVLDGPELRSLEPAVADHALGALHLPDDHQVDNLLLVRALGMAAARAGAQFRTGYVRGVIAEGDRARGVDFDGQPLHAAAVVVAAGSWSGLVQGARVDPRAVRPARGQMVELQLRLPAFGHILFSDQGYLVPRRDGRILCGSTLEFAGFEKRVTASGLQRILAMALEVAPGLADAQVLSHWAGLRPWTQDHLPYIGPGPLEGLFLATGHFRNGILLAPITAQLVADAVLGRPPTVDLTPFRFDRGPNQAQQSERSA